MNILVLDDHILFAEGIKLVLQEMDGIHAEVAIATGYEGALELMEAQHFDLVLVDIFMPRIDGFQALKGMLASTPQCRCMAISSCDNPIQVQQILDLGAMGFISKSSSALEMIKAIKQGMAGQVYIPEEMRTYLNIEEDSYAVSTLSDPSEEDRFSRKMQHLTPRQREVLSWMSQGKTNKEIAAILRCSEATIKAHITAILKCFDVNNRTEIARLAANHDWALQNSVA